MVSIGGKGETIGGLGDEMPQKLKQFPDIVYRFWLQKRSKFEIFTQFTSYFLTSMFYRLGLSDVLGLSPLTMPAAVTAQCISRSQVLWHP